MIFQWLVCFSLTLTCWGWENGRVPPEERTPLDDYCAKEDPSYEYFEIDNTRIDDENTTLFFINMTSQTWLNDTWSSRSLWWHYMVICVPHNLRFKDVASIFIGAGSSRNPETSVPIPDNDALTIAVQTFCWHTDSITAYLKQIPNQPIVFTEDPTNRSRSEDRMIAYTWREWIDDENMNPEKIARLPMTKAVVRAMDTITDFMKKNDSEIDIQKYVLAGGSKRGWTTWTATAVDKRVIAQVPMVLTALNFLPNLHKHWRSLGGWSFALRSYYEERNLTKELDNPRTMELMQIVEPWTYMSRYTMPTFVVAATGDQFFLPDDSWMFYDGIPAEKKFFYIVAGGDHSLAPWVDIYLNFASFFLGVVTDWDFPNCTWTREYSESGGKITFNSSRTPREIHTWYAYTDNNQTGIIKRDFRANRGPDAEEAPIEWLEEDVQDEGNNIYSREFNDPDEGYLCFLIEAVYDGPEGEDLYLTSEVQILPNSYPFPDCHGAGCHGTIV